MNEIAVERPHLFEPNVYVTVCVEVSGVVAADDLACAVEKAYKANETTMSKIVLTQGRCYYEKLSESRCTVDIVDSNWSDIVKENEKKAFAIDKGELMRTFIIPREETTQILIMAHHLAGDGQSMICFIKDIMNALSGKALKYKPLALVARDSLPRKGLSLLAKSYTRYCRRKWSGQTFTWQDFYDLHNKYWRYNTSDIRCETLSEDKTLEIIEKSKLIGCSVNSFIVTEFLRKHQKTCEVGIPVSIRQKGDETLSNFVSGISIRYKYDNKKTFAENALRVHKSVERKLRDIKFFVLQFIAELPPTLIDAVLLNKYGLCESRLAEKTARVMSYTGKIRDIGISNLGKLDIPTEYGSCKIENVIFVPPAISYSDNIIGVSTINGRMTITHHDMIRSE